MKDYLLRFYEYDLWANRRVLHSLREQTHPAAKAQKLFSHILASEQVWMTRLQDKDSSGIPILPDLSLDECALLLEQYGAAFNQFIHEATEESLRQTIAYKNSRGEAFTTPIEEVLTHVANHGTYHRGQIATMMREAGGNPINTDFITFVREKQ